MTTPETKKAIHKLLVARKRGEQYRCVYCHEWFSWNRTRLLEPEWLMQPERHTCIPCWKQHNVGQRVRVFEKTKPIRK
jgi:hypothetical protein